MYGHEAINGIKKSMKILKLDKNTKKINEKYTNNVIKYIRNAMHFHIGSDNETIDNLREKSDINELFCGSIDVKLPYSSCWFASSCAILI